jgi:hypothetical protein
MDEDGYFQSRQPEQVFPGNVATFLMTARGLGSNG